MMGTQNTPTIGLIDQNNPKVGVKISYNNRDMCEASENSKDIFKPRRVSFFMYCS